MFCIVGGETLALAEIPSALCGNSDVFHSLNNQISLRKSRHQFALTHYRVSCSTTLSRNIVSTWFQPSLQKVIVFGERG